MISLSALSLGLAAAGKPPPAPHESLYGTSPLLKAYEGSFGLGTAVPGDYLTDPRYASRLDFISHHFDHVVSENEMKWEAIQPEEGTFNFEEADRLVEWAEANDLRIWGHTLIWHNQVPDWVFRGPDGETADADLLRSRLRTHIKTVMQRYRGRVYGWDIVNEVLTRDPDNPFRDSRWYRILGMDFIIEAIKTARSTDPDALLAINDYAMSDPGKRESALYLLDELREADAMPDVFGMQSHFSVYWPPFEAVEKSLRLLSEKGVRIAISEFDMSVYDWGDNSDRYAKGLPEPLALLQADRIARMMALYRHHAESLERVTHWGVFDDRNWKNYYPVDSRRDYAGLIDYRGLPKPAFLAFQSPEAFHSAFGPVPVWRPEEWSAVPEITLNRDEPVFFSLTQLVVPPNRLIDRGRLRVAATLSRLPDALLLTVEVTDHRWNGRSPEETALRVFLDGSSYSFSPGDLAHWHSSEDGEILKARFPLPSHSAQTLSFDVEWLAPKDDARGHYSLRWADSSHGRESPENPGLLHLQ